MAEKKKRFISLNTKIIVSLLPLILACCGIGYIIASNCIGNYTLYYYNKITTTIYYVSIDRICDYFNGASNGQEQMQEVADECFKLCQDNIVDMVYVVTIDADSGIGDVVMEATHEETYVLKDGEKPTTYKLDDYEFEALNNNGDTTTGIYETRLYGKVFSFTKRFTATNPNTGKSFTGLFGVNLKANVFDGLVTRTLLVAALAITLIFAIFTIALVLMLRKRVVRPLAEMSERMRHFAGSGKVFFTPITYKHNDEIGVLSSAFNTMAADISNYVDTVKQYEAEQQRGLAEIHLASQIQVGLLPSPTYDDKLFQARGFMRPARNVGGDFYFYKRLEGGKIAFAIGDVSGKGFSAAMFMSSVTSAIKYALRMCDSPAEVLTRVNDDIVSENPKHLFVTIFVGILNAEDNTLTYANAGHNNPYYVTSTPIELEDAHGVCVGLFEDEEYENATIAVEPGGKILLYTDGVTEAVNEQRSFFGKERLEELLRQDCGDITARITNTIDSFTEGTEQNDDITMLEITLIDKNHLTLKASRESIKDLKEFVMSYDKLDDSLKRRLYLACEEIFVNIYSYGYPNREPGTVEFSFIVEGDSVSICFKDDGIPFNPLESIVDPEEYDVDTQVGGLGRLLAVSLMDESEYRFENSRNVLLMKKYLAQ